MCYKKLHGNPIGTGKFVAVIGGVVGGYGWGGEGGRSEPWYNIQISMIHWDWRDLIYWAER